MSYKSVSSLAVAMLLALSLASPALAGHVGHSDVDHGALGADPDNARGTNAGPGTNSIGEPDKPSETDANDVDPGSSGDNAGGGNRAPGSVDKTP